MRKQNIQSTGDDGALALGARKSSRNHGPISFGAHLISAIRNLVCPQCGGPMGGRTQEFQCQGQCGSDWRSVWEQTSANVLRGIPASDKSVVCPNAAQVASAASDTTVLGRTVAGLPHPLSYPCTRRHLYRQTA